MEKDNDLDEQTAETLLRDEDFLLIEGTGWTLTYSYVTHLALCLIKLLKLHRCLLSHQCALSSHGLLTAQFLPTAQSLNFWTPSRTCLNDYC